MWKRRTDALAQGRCIGEREAVDIAGLKYYHVWYIDHFVNYYRFMKGMTMGKINKNDRVKHYKCEVCLREMPIEYYFTPGDSITCTGCGTEYVLRSKSPLELAMQTVDYTSIDLDEPY